MSRNTFHRSCIFLRTNADTGLRFFLTDYKKYAVHAEKKKLNFKDKLINWMIAPSLKHQILCKRLYGTYHLIDWNTNWKEVKKIHLYIAGNDFLMRQLDLKSVKKRLGKNKTVIHYKKKFSHGDFINNFEKYI